MIITRRLFLGSLIAGTGLATSPAMAEFLIQNNRYQRLVEAQKLVTEASERVHMMKAAWDGRYYDDEIAQQMLGCSQFNISVEHLFDVLETDFGDRTPMRTHLIGVVKRVNALLNRQVTIDTLSEEELARFEDILIVVAVVRNLMGGIRDHSLSKWIMQSPGWYKFNRDYALVMLTSEIR